MLEVEGRKLCQSLAMQRYFAKKFNLVGSNDFEAAQIDEYVDSSKEVFQSESFYYIDILLKNLCIR